MLGGMAFFLLPHVLVASVMPALRILDEQGIPIVGARVMFTDASGARDSEKSIDNGYVSVRDGFVAVRLRIEAQGFTPKDIVLGTSVPAMISLTHGLPVIASVRVANGSPSSLHELPVNASLLDKSALQIIPALTSDGLLRELPGFDRTRSNSAFTNYGQLRVSFDGAGNDRGTVLVDGIPAQDAFGGQVDWAAYPAGEITRAELLRDAGSALYGSGAIGGVLNLQTLGPATQTRAPAGGQAALGIGGFDGRDESLFAQGSLGPKLNASIWTSDTQLAYRDFPASYASPVNHSANSQSDATNVRLRYNVGTGSALNLSGLYTTDAQDEGRPNYTFARSIQQYAAQYAHDGARTTTTFSVYERDASILNTSDAYPSKPGVLLYVQHVPSWENGLSGAYTAHIGEHEVQVHAEQRSVHGIAVQDGPSQALESSGSGSQTLTGFALQDTLRLRRFGAIMGARYDTIAFTNGNTITAATGSVIARAPARTDAAISPRAALRYDLTPNAALRISSGSGIRAPYLNELLRGYSIGATRYLPDIDLVPERSHTDSAGIDLLGSRTHATADIFSTRVSDAIGFTAPDPTNTNILKRSNVDRTQTDGTTFTVTQSFNPKMRLRLSETSQYARIVEGPIGSVGKRPQFVPNHSVGVGFDVDSGALLYGFDVDYLGQTYSDDLDTEPLGGALLFGMRATWPLKNGASWSVLWQNMTNQKYLTSVDRIGLPAQASVRYAFPLGRPSRMSESS